MQPLPSGLQRCPLPLRQRSREGGPSQELGRLGCTLSVNRMSDRRCLRFSAVVLVEKGEHTVTNVRGLEGLIQEIQVHIKLSEGCESVKGHREEGASVAKTSGG